MAVGSRTGNESISGWRSSGSRSEHNTIDDDDDDDAADAADAAAAAADDVDVDDDKC